MRYPRERTNAYLLLNPSFSPVSRNDRRRVVNYPPGEPTRRWLTTDLRRTSDGA